MDEDAAVEQLHLEHAVKATHRGVGQHQLAEEAVTEGHARADEGRSHAQHVVAATEDGVVDFLADGVEISHRSVEIFSYAVGLYGLHVVAGGKGGV